MIVWQEPKVMAMVGVFPVTPDLQIPTMEELVCHVQRENQVKLELQPVRTVRKVLTIHQLEVFVFLVKPVELIIRLDKQTVRIARQEENPVRIEQNVFRVQ